jgi:hypothetical protein
MKRGDKVWVLCLVLEVEDNSVLVCGNADKSWWVRDIDCKPVETEAVEQSLTADPVNPSHYKQCGIEDLKKARWYLDRLIQEEEAK